MPQEAATSATPAQPSAPTDRTLIPLQRARELLGLEAEGLSDAQVSRMCRELEDYARILLIAHEASVHKTEPPETAKETPPGEE